MNIVVLAGGLSPERNVSLSTGSMVAEALAALGHQAQMVDMFFGLTPEGESATHSGTKIDHSAPDLAQIRAARAGDDQNLFGPGVLELCKKADLVFIALHGACGEDGRLQATFDLLGIPYTGSGYLSSAIAMDKDLTKRLVADVVNTPAWQIIDPATADLASIVENTPLPAVVKPIASGSSIGVSIAQTPEELLHALQSAQGKTIIEQYIAGREIQIGILDGKTLPPIEIIPKHGFYDYENKYQAGAAEEICPAPISPTTAAALSTAALKVFTTLGLSVYSRVDFILDENEKLWFLEINTLPGMTPTSLLPQEAAAAGIDYKQLCAKIIDISLKTRRNQ